MSRKGGVIVDELTDQWIELRDRNIDRKVQNAVMCMPDASCCAENGCSRREYQHKVERWWQELDPTIRFLVLDDLIDVEEGLRAAREDNKLWCQETFGRWAGAEIWRGFYESQELERKWRPKFLQDLMDARRKEG